MKNVTITLEEEVARWARIEAAKKDTRMSRMLADELKRQMERAQRYSATMDRFMGR